MTKRMFLTAGDVAAMLGFHGPNMFLSRRAALEEMGFPKRIPWCQRPFKWKRSSVEDWIDAADDIASAMATAPDTMPGADPEKVVMMKKARVA